MRPIDADALHGEISGLAVMVTGIRCGKGLLLELMTDYRKHILRAIANAPTIDAVPVVRCEKCACFEEATGKDSGNPAGYGRCRRPFGLTGIVSADDFCSYGERRSDD